MKIGLKKWLAILLLPMLVCSAKPFPAVKAAESPLQGKTALLVGDSICYGQWDNEPRQGYAGRIAQQYGMTVDNPAIGGTTFSTIRPVRIVEQIKASKDNTYDYVIIQGGVNDACAYVDDKQVYTYAPVGKITESFQVEDFDLSTFAGGLEELIYYTLEYFPNAKVGFMTNFACPMSTSSMGRAQDMYAYYYEALKICEKWGIQVLDLYNSYYVTNTLLKTKTYTYLKDPLHPNAAGYDRLAPYIGDWMETLVSREEYMMNPFKGKRVLFAGDSISYGSGDSVKGRAWAGRMADALGIVAENNSVIGSSISTIRPSRVVEQIKMRNEYFDYVILHGGVNDSWGYDPDYLSAPVGEVTDSYMRRDFDTDTFAGGLEELFYYARYYFPYARIGYILNFEIPSDVCDDVGIYREVALEICRKWQVDCLDMYGDDVRGNLLENNSSKYMKDSGHPNAAGYEKLTPYIIDWFKSIPYTDTSILENQDIYTEITPVNKKIDEIGEVTAQNYQEKLAAIETAEQALKNLTDIYGAGILPMIGKYETLVKARETYDAIANPQTDGDVNGDGTINAVDALWTLQAAVDKRTLNQNQTNAADMNKDGTLDATDALKILQKAVGK